MIIRVPDETWTERWGDKPVCEIGAKDTWKQKCIPRSHVGEMPLFLPTWLPADQPMPVRDSDGRWMKLQL